MRIVDTKGQLCPAPIIAAKKALRETSDGESFKVLTDNHTSYTNLCRFFRDNHVEFHVSEAGGIWAITITKAVSEAELTNADDYCNTEVPHFNKGNFVVVFSSDKMGEGDDELGSLLLANFIKAIKDLDILPSKMAFYNKGVLLGCDDSTVIEDLREIEKMGVELFLCGTCIKHYSIENKINIGSVSNMFEIAQIMSSSGNTIKP